MSALAATDGDALVRRWMPIVTMILLAGTNVVTAYCLYRQRNRQSDEVDMHFSAEGDRQPNDLDDTSNASPRDESSAADSDLMVANSPPGAESARSFRSQHVATEVSGQPSVSRVVHCMDTNVYLRAIATPSSTGDNPIANADAPPVETSLHPSDCSWSGCSVITSVPDVCETGLPLAQWRVWFRQVCTDILRRIDRDNVAIFYQTDIRTEKQWISKPFLIMQAAESVGVTLVWHKMVLVNNIMTVRGRTASFVHLLCFSRGHVENHLALTPDVLAHRGAMLWKRAMGLRAAEFACRYLVTHVPAAQCVVDPFCGSGSAIAMANRFGLSSVGVDHCRKRCVQASQLPVAEVAERADDGADEVQAEKDVKRAQKAERKAQRAASGRTQREQQLWEKEQNRLAKLDADERN